MKNVAVILATMVALTGYVQAGEIVAVTVTGEVEFNFIGEPPLSGVGPGDTASLTFLVDSDIFVDGAGNTRGYEIDQSSFLLAFSSGVSLGLLDPFPAGQTPYFTLADGIPVADRFWVSTSANSPGGVPLEQEPVNANVDLGYTGDTLNSLDILDALGTYDFDGLTSFGFNLWSIFPDNVGLGMVFEQMTISAEIVTVPPALDIKPGSCPNSFNRNSHGVLPVALVGTDDFDIALVDILSVRLSRADGVGGEVAPNEGPPGPHSVLDDVASPSAPSMECECDEMEGDGVLDLSMKFRTDDVVAALALNDLPAGDLVPLVVTGTLLDGTPFETATDCIRLVPPGTPNAPLSVSSNISGVWMNVVPLDDTLDGGGFANFVRNFPQTTVITLTAEMFAEGQPLMGWRIDGEFVPLSHPPMLLRWWNLSSYTVIADEVGAVEAVYGIRRPIRPAPTSGTPIIPGGIVRGG